jgi:FixJ family two-component response regulator
VSRSALIHVVEDDEPVRASLIDLLHAAGFEVQAYGSAGDFLLRPVPDRLGCLILDIRLPGPSGLDLQEALDHHKVAIPVIFLTGFADVSTTVRAMKAGAVDFLEKPVVSDLLLEAVSRALEFDAAARAVREVGDRRHARLAVLTSRERQVFDCIIAGRLNKQIAADLGVSLRTVKGYRAELMRKLDVRSAAELGRLAGEQGSADGFRHP